MAVNELNYWKLVNSCESIEELENAVETIAAAHLGEIPGRGKGHNGERQKSAVSLVIQGKAIPTALTRNYGIRQQAIYLKSKKL